MAGQASLASMIWMPVRKERFAMRTAPESRTVQCGNDADHTPHVVAGSVDLCPGRWHRPQQPLTALPPTTAIGIIVKMPYVENLDGHSHTVVGHGVHLRGGKRHVSPLVSLDCFVCTTPVGTGMLTVGEVGWSRVKGDSRYGYEPYHTACCEQ